MKPTVLWLTGMSGAGKSTLARHLESVYRPSGVAVETIDGDVVRQRFGRESAFTPDAIRENNLLIADLARELVATRALVIVSVIAPFRAVRAEVRARLTPAYVEAHVVCGLDELRRRDTKGLYGRFDRGELPNLVGMSRELPYEVPEAPELVVPTERTGVARAAETIVSYLERERGIHGAAL